MNPRITTCLALALLTAACNGTPTTHTPTTKPSPTATPGQPSATPTPAGTATPAPTTDRALTGTVLGLDGKPAVDVQVQAYIVSNNGGSLISPNGGDLVPKLKYALADAGLTAKTDAQGHFRLVVPGTDPVNLEAVQSKNVKAALLAVSPTQTDVSMALAATGGIKGQVKSRVAGVTNFEGVDVFIPGLPYSVKADAAGNFTLADVPAAKAGLAYTLVASKTGLGRGEAKVTVYPEAFAQVPSLDLTPEVSVVKSISPDYGTSASGNHLVLAGDKLTITGQNFGATRGAPFQVFLGDKEVPGAKRVDDQTIEVTVPAQAGSGTISVKVDGVPGTTLPFVQFASIGIRRKGATTLDAGTSMVVGEPLAFEVFGGDFKDENTALSGVTITAQGATVDAKGLVTASAAGPVTLTATVGTLTAKRTFTAAPAGFTRHTLATGSWINGVGDGKGGLYLLKTESGTRGAPVPVSLQHMDAAGAVSTVAALGTVNPSSLDLTAMPDGSVIIRQDQDFKRVTPQGQVTVQPGSPLEAGGSGGVLAGLGSDAAGNFYGFERILVMGTPTSYYVRLVQLNASGQGTVVASTPVSLQEHGGGQVVANGHKLYFADIYNQQVWQVDLDQPVGPVTLLAGQAQDQGDAKVSKDGLGAAASFKGFAGIALDAGGNLKVLDGNALRNITPAGQVTTLLAECASGKDDANGEPVTACQDLSESAVALGLDAQNRPLIVTTKRVYRYTLP